MANPRTEQLIDEYAAFLWTQNVGPEGDTWEELDLDERANYIDNENIKATVDWFWVQVFQGELLSGVRNHQLRLLTEAIAKIAVAAGADEENIGPLTGPLALDLAEQTRGWVAQMYAQSEVGQEEHRHDRLSTNRSLRPLMTLEDAQRIVRQHEDEQDDGEPVDTAFPPGLAADQ